LDEQVRKRIEDSTLISNLTYNFYATEDYILRPWDIKQRFQSKKFKVRNQIKQNKALVEKISKNYNVPIVTLFAIKAIEDGLNFQDENKTLDALVTMLSYNEAFEPLLLSTLELEARNNINLNDFTLSDSLTLGQTHISFPIYETYGVDSDKDGVVNPWSSLGDALSTTANYLVGNGWVDAPSLVRVKLTDGFDFELADGRVKTVSEWLNLGMEPSYPKAVDGLRDDFQSKLWLPTGSEGAAYLTLPNFDLIANYREFSFNKENMKYYALAVELVQRSVFGLNDFDEEWLIPAQKFDLRLSNIQRLQKVLEQEITGEIDTETFHAILNWQKANNIVADGYLDIDTYSAILNEAGLIP